MLVRLCKAEEGRVLADEASLLIGLGLLRPDEAMLALTALVSTRQAQRIYGPALLRSLAAEATGVPPDRIELRRGVHGRPECVVPSGHPPSISLAHDGGAIVGAVSRHGLVGIDVEPLFHRQMALDLVEEFLHPEEKDLVANSPDRGLTALRLWTQKEAYLKAIGTGFQIDPRSVSISALGGDWSLASAHIEGAWLLSVAQKHGGALDLSRVRFSLFPWVDRHP